MSESQAVAEQPNGEATPSPEAAGGAQDDLDTLLKQFETPKAESKPEAKAGLPADVKEVVEFVREEKQRKAAESTRSDIGKAVSVVKTALEEIGKELPDSVLEGALEAQARKDPRIAQAWVNRGQNPEAWEQVVQGVAKKIKADFETLPDRHATEDKAAVRAAVRSASTRAPEPEPFDSAKLNKMSNAEFKQFKRSLG